jgi:hypothetical protein
MRAVMWHGQRPGAELLGRLAGLQLRVQLWERQLKLQAAQVRIEEWSRGE